MTGMLDAPPNTAMVEAEERQTRIVELEEEWETLARRLDFLVEQFMQQVHGAAANWIQQEFTRGIRDNAEQVQELGPAGVRVIKNDMEFLIKALPSACAELLHDRASWAHYDDESLLRRNGPKEFFLDRIFRDLISTAGPVLERHNLLGNRGNHSYWQRVKNGWRYGMNTSEPVTPEIAEEYKKGLERVREIKLKHATEKKHLAEVRAQTLWDSV